MSEVRRNALVNIIGIAIPIAVGFLAMPILVNNLGVDRVGVFTLALGIVGIVSILDMGLTRSLSQLIAVAQGEGRNVADSAPLIAYTLKLTLLIGTAGGIVLWLSAESVAMRLHSPGRVDEAELVMSIRWLSAAIPAILVIGTLSGVLEGLQQFVLLNKIRTPLGIATFLLPTAGSYLFTDIDQIIALLVLTRVGGALACLQAVRQLVPYATPVSVPVNSSESSALWRCARGLAVSNIVGPLMVVGDRYYLALFFPPGILALHTITLDTLLRATAIPMAVMSAGFPALAKSGIRSDEAGHIVIQATGFMLVAWCIPIMVIGAFTLPLLTLWLGQPFAGNATEITRWLLFGFLVNGFGNIPYTLLQSARRSDLTAALHLAEMPIYAAMLMTLVALYGIPGAAMAWAARVAFDTIALYCFALVKFPERQRDLIFSLTGAAFAVLAYALAIFFSSH